MEARVERNSGAVSTSRERLISFSAEMVQAILAGQKTQTRRPVRSAHVSDADAWAPDVTRGIWESGVYGDGGALAHGEYVHCPYGAPGDRLVVSFGLADAQTLTLEGTSIRIERLQEISEEDALAEGITGPHRVGYPAFRVPGDSKPRYSSAVAAFEALWDSIYGERPGSSWEANPWVWVIGFKPVSR